MKVAISGGTGFVGKRLRELLHNQGHEVIVLTRGEEKVENGIHYIRWMDGIQPEQALEGIDAFVNLAGVSLNEGRWTHERKKAIYDSSKHKLFKRGNFRKDHKNIIISVVHFAV